MCYDVLCYDVFSFLTRQFDRVSLPLYHISSIIWVESNIYGTSITTCVLMICVMMTIICNPSPNEFHHNMYCSLITILMFQRSIIIGLYYFSLKQVNNSKCYTVVRGSLGYQFISTITWISSYILFTTILIYLWIISMCYNGLFLMRQIYGQILFLPNKFHYMGRMKCLWS